MKVVNCPHCGRSNAAPADTNYFSCMYCGGHIDLIRMPLYRPQPDPEVDIVTYYEGGNLCLRYRRFSTSAVVGFILSLIISGLILGAIYLLPPGEQSGLCTGLMTWVVWSICISGLYFSLANMLEVSIIKMDGNEFQVRHQPIPLPGKQLLLAEIVQVRHLEVTKVNEPGTSSLQVTKVDERGISSAQHHLVAQMKDGRVIFLLRDINSAYEAEELAKQINPHLPGYTVGKDPRNSS
jgi:hypothetical protein